MADAVATYVDLEHKSGKSNASKKSKAATPGMNVVDTENSQPKKISVPQLQRIPIYNFKGSQDSNPDPPSFPHYFSQKESAAAPSLRPKSSSAVSRPSTSSLQRPSIAYTMHSGRRITEGLGDNRLIMKVAHLFPDQEQEDYQGKFPIFRNELIRLNAIMDDALREIRVPNTNGDITDLPFASPTVASTGNRCSTAVGTGKKDGGGIEPSTQISYTNSTNMNSVDRNFDSVLSDLMRQVTRKAERLKDISLHYSKKTRNSSRGDDIDADYSNRHQRRRSTAMRRRHTQTQNRSTNAAVASSQAENQQHQQQQEAMDPENTASRVPSVISKKEKLFRKLLAAETAKSLLSGISDTDDDGDDDEDGVGGDDGAAAAAAASAVPDCFEKTEGISTSSDRALTAQPAPVPVDDTNSTTNSSSSIPLQQRLPIAVTRTTVHVRLPSVLNGINNVDGTGIGTDTGSDIGTYTATRSGGSGAVVTAPATVSVAPTVNSATCTADELHSGISSTVTSINSSRRINTSFGGSGNVNETNGHLEIARNTNQYEDMRNCSNEMSVNPIDSNIDNDINNDINDNIHSSSSSSNNNRSNNARGMGSLDCVVAQQAPAVPSPVSLSVTARGMAVYGTSPNSVSSTYTNTKNNNNNNNNVYNSIIQDVVNLQHSQPQHPQHSQQQQQQQQQYSPSYQRKQQPHSPLKYFKRLEKRTDPAPELFIAPTGREGMEETQQQSPAAAEAERQLQQDKLKREEALLLALVDVHTLAATTASTVITATLEEVLAMAATAAATTGAATPTTTATTGAAHGAGTAAAGREDNSVTASETPFYSYEHQHSSAGSASGLLHHHPKQQQPHNQLTLLLIQQQKAFDRVAFLSQQLKEEQSLLQDCTLQIQQFLLAPDGTGNTGIAAIE